MTYQCHLYYEEQTQFRARERSTIASLVFMGLLEIWYDICNFCFIKNSDVRDCGNELLRVAPCERHCYVRFVLYLLDMFIDIEIIGNALSPQA